MQKAARDFHERMLELELRMECLRESVGMNPDAPLPTAVWAVAGAYREAIDAAHSIGGWLEWWWLECGLGERPKKANLGDGQGERLIATIDDLVALLTAEAGL